jgi:serine/threonine protein phosphatase PrpC
MIYMCSAHFFSLFHIKQAYNLSRDHKPELEAERERIRSAGGYIQIGRVNGALNLSRAIGMIFLLAFLFIPQPYMIAYICKYVFRRHGVQTEQVLDP